MATRLVRELLLGYLPDGQDFSVTNKRVATIRGWVPRERSILLPLGMRAHICISWIEDVKKNITSAKRLSIFLVVSSRSKILFLLSIVCLFHRLPYTGGRGILGYMWMVLSSKLNVNFFIRVLVEFHTPKIWKKSTSYPFFMFYL